MGTTRKQFLIEVISGLQKANRLLTEDRKEEEPLDHDFLDWIIEELMDNYARLVGVGHGVVTNSQRIEIIGVLFNQASKIATADVIQRATRSSRPNDGG